MDQSDDRIVWAHKTKRGKYVIVRDDIRGAGTINSNTIVLYKSVGSGTLYARTLKDFFDKMEVSRDTLVASDN